MTTEQEIQRAIAKPLTDRMASKPDALAYGGSRGKPQGDPASGGFPTWGHGTADGSVSDAVPVGPSGTAWRTDNPYADGSYLGVPQGYQGRPTYTQDGKAVQGEMFYRTNNQYDHVSHMDEKARADMKTRLLVAGFYKDAKSARATIGSSQWSQDDFDALSAAMGMANLNGRKVDDLLTARVEALSQPNQGDSLRMQADAVKAEDELRGFAARNGVSYSDDYYKTAVKQVVEGGADLNSVVHDMRARDVMGAFPAWAQQIEAGQDVAALASPYMNAMQRILGVQADVFDPSVRRAMQGVGGDGQPTTTPLWKYEQQLRDDPRWASSDDAKNGLGGMAAGLLNTFGLV